MKVCEITGKTAIVGNNVSHSHHRHKKGPAAALREAAAAKTVY